MNKKEKKEFQACLSNFILEITNRPVFWSWSKHFDVFIKNPIIFKHLCYLVKGYQDWRVKYSHTTPLTIWYQLLDEKPTYVKPDIKNDLLNKIVSTVAELQIKCHASYEYRLMIRISDLNTIDKVVFELRITDNRPIYGKTFPLRVNLPDLNEKKYNARAKKYPNDDQHVSDILNATVDLIRDDALEKLSDAMKVHLENAVKTYCKLHNLARG